MRATSASRKVGSLTSGGTDRVPHRLTVSVPPEPEYALLLDVAVPLDRQRVDHAAWDGGRWGHTLNIADWHRLSPALFSHLRSTGGAPSPVLAALERAYLANAARSLFIRAAADRALQALDGAGIGAMLLKGAALVETVYGDPAEREMLDIDVLVPLERLHDAEAALTDLGYRKVPGEAADQGADHVRVTTPHDLALVSQEQLVAIELHRHIAMAEEGGGFDLGGMWERARSAPDTGHVVPSPEDLLIHVCFHFTRNRLGGSARRRNTGGALAQISDVNRIVQREQVDWDVLARTSREFGLRSRVFLGLFAASEVGVEIPADALAQVAPPDFDRDLGRRLVALRVLRAGDHMPVRSMRWMFAPSREALSRGWNAEPTATLSLARAYMRRAKAHVPEARSALRQPWVYVQDQRLNSQLEALEERW